MPMAVEIAAQRAVQEASDKSVPIAPIDRSSREGNRAYLLGAVLGNGKNGLQRRIVMFL